MTRSLNLNQKLGIAAALATAAGASRADVDFTSLTTGIAFTGVVTAILAVAAVKVLPLVAMWGSKKILSMVGR